MTQEKIKLVRNYAQKWKMNTKEFPLRRLFRMRLVDWEAQPVDWLAFDFDSTADNWTGSRLPLLGSQLLAYYLAFFHHLQSIFL